MMKENKKINKKSRNVIVLVIALVTLLLLYFLYDKIAEKVPSAKETTEDVVSTENETIKVGDFSILDIVSFEYTNKDYSIRINISEKGMTKADEEDFPLNSETINTQLTRLASLTSDKTLPIENKSEYGFDEPNASATVTLSNGSTRSFIIGDQALFENMYYLLDVDNDKIYYIDSYLYTSLSSSFSRLIKAEDVPSIDTTTLQKVEISGEESTTISRNSDNELTWHVLTNDLDFSSNSEDLETKLENLSNITMTEVIEYKCEDFSKYGLDAPAESLIADYSESDENGEVSNKQLILEFGSTDEYGYYYCRMNKSSYVYTMSSTYHDNLIEYSAEDYLPQQSVE